jgi:hypothetical protein
MSKKNGLFMLVVGAAGGYLAAKYGKQVVSTVKSSIDKQPIEDLVEGDPYGPRGVGEIGTIAIIPAIVKAIHDATGCWIKKLPVCAEELLEKMEQKGMFEWV